MSASETPVLLRQNALTHVPYFWFVNLNYISSVHTKHSKGVLYGPNPILKPVHQVYWIICLLCSCRWNFPPKSHFWAFHPFAPQSGSAIRSLSNIKAQVSAYVAFGLARWYYANLSKTQPWIWCMENLFPVACMGNIFPFMLNCWM